MSVVNGYVTKEGGISLQALAALLGTKQDLGTICTTGSINPYSKFKPIEATDIMVIGGSLANREAAYKNANWGYNIPNASMADIAKWMWGVVGSAWIAPTNSLELNDNWSYNAPTSIFRISDFIGYDHKTQRKILTKAVLVDDQSAETGKDSEDMDYYKFYSCDKVRFKADNAAFSLLDFNSLKDMYLGIVFAKTSSNVFCITNTSKISSDTGRFIDIQLKDILDKPNGTGTPISYRMLFVASSVPLTKTDDKVDNLVVLPFKFDRMVYNLALANIGRTLIAAYVDPDVNKDTRVRLKIEIKNTGRAKASNVELCIEDWGDSASGSVYMPNGSYLVGNDTYLFDTSHDYDYSITASNLPTIKYRIRYYDNGDNLLYTLPSASGDPYSEKASLTPPQGV